jgi:hypothetical protein
VIAEHHNGTDELPTTMEGWMVRAKYFEALWKHEKLTSAKLRANNRNLTNHIYGRSSEKLSDAQRVLFGILGNDAPADLTDEGRALMKEARKGVDDCVLHVMPVHDFGACRSKVSRDAGPRFHGMSVQVFTPSRSKPMTFLT